MTGSLTKEAASTLPVAGASVAVKVAAPGKAPAQVATGKTAANGTFSIPVALKLSGDLTVVYTGGAGLPAATTAVDTVSAESWDVSIGTPTASPATVAPAKPATLTGSVTRTYDGATEPAQGARPHRDGAADRWRGHHGEGDHERERSVLVEGDAQGHDDLHGARHRRGRARQRERVAGDGHRDAVT